MPHRTHGEYSNILDCKVVKDGIVLRIEKVLVADELEKKEI